MAISRGSDHDSSSEPGNRQTGGGNSNEQKGHQFYPSQDDFPTGIDFRTIPLQSSKSLAPSFKNGDGRVRDSDFGRCRVRNSGASCDEDICSLINQKMRERTENLVSVAKGITRRMAQLDIITSRVEDSIDSLSDTTEYYHGRTHVKLKEMESMIREIQGGIRDLRDKREIAEAQLRLAKLQTLGAESADTQSEITNKGPLKVAVQPALSSPLQDQQPIACPQQSPYLTSNVSPNPPPNILHSAASTAVDYSYQLELNQNPPVDMSLRSTPVQFPNPAHQYYNMPLSQASLTPIATVHDASLNQQFSSSGQLSSMNMYSSSHPRTHSSNQSPQQISFVDTESHVSSMPSSSCVQNAFFPDQAAYNQPSNYSLSNFSSEYPRAPGNSGPANTFTGSASRSANSARESSQHLPSSSSLRDDGSYSSLPTGKELPHALPMALSVDAPMGIEGNEGSLGTDDVVDKVVAMGFRRDFVRATVRKLKEDGGSVDPNTVLDKLMSDSRQ